MYSFGYIKEDKMKLIKVKNYEEMSQKAAEIIINDILKKQDITIGFATGSTPLGIYKKLVKAHKQGKVDFSKITAFALDEYYPIKKSDKNSYYYYLFKNLFAHINIKKSNISLLNGETKAPNKECKNYENKIMGNKIDIQIFGVGRNGHIAFNEPGSIFNSKTRLVELAPETIKINSRFFKNKKKVPKSALTMGISTIMKSRKIILLASGKNKAEAIKCLVECKPNKCCPISFLKKHKKLIVVVDKEAGRFIY